MSLTKLGCTQKEQSADRSLIIGNDAIKLCLYEDPEKAKPGGIAHFGLYVQNFSEIVEKCESLGVPMPYGIVNWEKSRSIYIVDPNGYEIELSEVKGGGL
ncbi:MAG: VOC family protein [Tildeniella nuda ZEHNDER 1965/U140]|nr:VOC family protein [Tildeniella nuda ZEHNDER 1965/U140]